MPKKVARRAIDLGGIPSGGTASVAVAQTIQSPTQPAVIDEVAIANFTGHYLLGGGREIKYKGAEAWLSSQLNSNVQEIFVTAPVLYDGDKIMMSHYDVGHEEATILSDFVVSGSAYKYQVSRTELSNVFPAWETRVTRLGAPSSGGFIREAVGDDEIFPYTDYISNESGPAEVWKIRIGDMQSLPQEFKDKWATPDLGPLPDFDVEHGLATEDSIFADQLLAGRNMLIRNNANINNRLQVKAAASNAIIQAGNTISGYGLTTTSNSGQPLMIAVVALDDVDVWKFSISSERGHRVIDFETRPTDEGYTLKVGDMEFSDQHTWHRGEDGEFGTKLSWFNVQPVIKQDVAAYDVEQGLRNLLYALEAYGLITITEIGF